MNPLKWNKFTKQFNLIAENSESYFNVLLLCVCMSEKHKKLNILKLINQRSN